MAYIPIACIFIYGNANTNTTAFIATPHSLPPPTGELRVKKPVSRGLTTGSGRDSRRVPDSEPLSIETRGTDRVEDRIELEVEAQDDGT